MPIRIGGHVRKAQGVFGTKEAPPSTTTSLATTGLDVQSNLAVTTAALPTSTTKMPGNETNGTLQTQPVTTEQDDDSSATAETAPTMPIQSSTPTTVTSGIETSSIVPTTTQTTIAQSATTIQPPVVSQPPPPIPGTTMATTTIVAPPPPSPNGVATHAAPPMTPSNVPNPPLPISTPATTTTPHRPLPDNHRVPAPPPKNTPSASCHGYDTFVARFTCHATHAVEAHPVSWISASVLLVFICYCRFCRRRRRSLAAAGGDAQVRGEYRAIAASMTDEAFGDDYSFGENDEYLSDNDDDDEEEANGYGNGSIQMSTLGKDGGLSLDELNG